MIYWILSCLWVLPVAIAVVVVVTRVRGRRLRRRLGGLLALLAVLPLLLTAFLTLLLSQPWDQPYSISELQHALSVIGAPPGCQRVSESTESVSGRVQVFTEYQGSSCLATADNWFSSRLGSLGLKTNEGAAGACGALDIDLNNNMGLLEVEAWSASGIAKANDCPPGLLGS